MLTILHHVSDQLLSKSDVRYKAAEQVKVSILRQSKVTIVYITCRRFLIDIVIQQDQHRATDYQQGNNEGSGEYEFGLDKAFHGVLVSDCVRNNFRTNVASLIFLLSRHSTREAYFTGGEKHR